MSGKHAPAPIGKFSSVSYSGRMPFRDIGAYRPSDGRSRVLIYSFFFEVSFFSFFLLTLPCS